MAVINAMCLNPRSFTGRLVALAAALTTLILVYTYTAPPTFQINLPNITGTKSLCPPESYSNGSWAFRPRENASERRRPLTTDLTREGAIRVAGFSGCASSREVDWHLAVDKPDQWDRFPDVSSWEWMPGETCQGLRPLDPVTLVRELVEQGGWLLIGGKYITYFAFCGTFYCLFL